MSFFPPARLFILPSSLAAAQERDRLLDESPDGVILAPKIFTFGRFEQALARELADIEPPLPEVSEVGQALLLAILAGEEAEKLGWPIDLRRGAGLRGRILELIDQMRLSGVTAGQFIEAAGRAGIDNPKVASLAVIAARYEQALADRHVIDRAGRRRTILDELHRGWIPRLLSGVEEIALIRFNRLTPFQIEIIKALDRLIHRVRVEILRPDWITRENLDSDSETKWNPFRETLAEIKSIEASGDRNSGLEISEAQPGRPGIQTPCLSWIAQNLFHPRPEPAGPDIDGSLEIVAAPGRYAEVEEIGRRIFARLAEGAAPDRVVVAVRDLGAYGQLVEDVFRRFRLPFYFRRGAPLDIQTPSRALLSLLRLAGSNWSRDNVLDILASPCLDLGLPMDWERVAFLSAQAGVTDERAGGGWRVNFRRLSQSRPEFGPEIEAILSSLNRLREFLSPFVQPLTWLDFKREALALMKKLGLPTRLESGDGGHAGRDGHAWTALLEAFASLEASAGALGLSDRPFPPDVLQHWLQAELRSRNIGRTGGAGRGIMVLNAYDLHGLKCDYLFLAGLNEGEFPQLRSDNALLPDDLIQALNKSLGRLVFRPASMDYRQQVLLFYHALAAADRQVVLSYSRVDDRGRLRLASPLIDEILRLWPAGLVPTAEPSAGVLTDYEQVMTSQELFGTLAADLLGARLKASTGLGRTIVRLIHRDYPDQAAIWENAEKRAALLEQGFEAGEGDSARIPSSALEGWLASLKTYRGGPLISPTLFQQYADCPFAFWAGEILALDRIEETEDEIQPHTEGNICHAVLTRFLRGCREKKMLPLTGNPREWALLETSLNEICVSEEKRLPVGRGPLWRIRRQNLLRMLRRWLDREIRNADECLPADFEWVFGSVVEGKGEPPFCASLLEGGDLYFRGRVDRIDLSEDLARVLDYKTGSNRNKYQRLLKEEEIGVSSFQAPIYQCAVARSFGLPTEAGFVLLKDRTASRLKCSPLSDTDLFTADPETRQRLAEAGRPNFYNRLEATWRTLRQGYFPPRLDDARCGYCVFRFSCRAGGPGEGDTA